LKIPRGFDESSAQVDRKEQLEEGAT